MISLKKIWLLTSNTKDIRLIDFGLSKWDKDFDNPKTIQGIYGEAKTIKELFDEEMNMLCWLFDQKK